MKSLKEITVSREFEKWVKANNPKPHYAFTLYFTDEQNKELNDVISNKDIELHGLEDDVQEFGKETLHWGVYPYRDELCVVACCLDMDFSDFSEPFQEKMMELINDIISKPITDIQKKWCNS